MPSRPFIVAVAASLAVLAGATVANAATISGAGATFSLPIWQTLGAEYGRSTGNTINYQGVGSGAGKSQLIGKTVNWAGSDNILNPTEQANVEKAAGPAQHLPIALGAITIAYKVGGLKNHLKLDGPTIANIYLGKITKWNDKSIARLNKGVSLPDANITVVRRSESSGTSFGFTQFLSSWSGAWSSGPGTNQLPRWPVGIGARGNDGVAGAIAQGQNTIGYVEAAYALQNKFKVAAVKNRAGVFVIPSLKSAAASGTGLAVPPSLRVDVIDSKNKDAYPITSQTFAIVYKDLCRGGSSPEQATLTKKFLDFVVGKSGQTAIEKLSYAPLPAGLQKKVATAVGSLTCNGNRIS